MSAKRKGWATIRYRPQYHQEALDIIARAIWGNDDTYEANQGSFGVEQAKRKAAIVVKNLEAVGMDITKQEEIEP